MAKTNEPEARLEIHDTEILDIDEVEALCVELLKQVFQARYADHRLVSIMAFHRG
jgi:hypothetical protein